MTRAHTSHPEAFLRVAMVACFNLLCALQTGVAQADDNTIPATNASSPAKPADYSVPADETWAVHGQLSNITQAHPQFTSPYSGPNSLSANGPMEETTDLTLMTGVRLWRGAEFWLNAEVDQGFGLDNTLGLAGYPNGGAYKLGANTPYLRLPRAFIRQMISLGGEDEKVDAAANQLGGTHAANNIALTVGKFSVTDIFDNNRYAHDPRADFLNWAIIDAGAFDYAADSWGYTYGAAAEWTQRWWTLRAGYFELSLVPNGKVAHLSFYQNSPMLEAEGRYDLHGHPGKLKLLAFVNRGDMGTYRDAIELGRETNSIPDVSLVRRYNSRAGYAINLEQEVSSDCGVFARVSANDGSKEAYEFSDINKSVSGGFSLKGDRWGRHDDTVGLAAVVNALSHDAREFFAAGGLGILVGDGKLTYAPEKIVEAYYALHVDSYITVTLDFQHVNNPAYNLDRGPVNIYGLRVHAQF